MKKVIFIGGKGLSTQVATWMLLEKNKYKIIGLYDDYKSSTMLKNLGKIRDLKYKKNIIYILAIGDPFLRKRIYLNLKKKFPKIIFSNYVHPSALIYNKKKLLNNEGLIIGPNVLIENNVKIGKGCVFNAYSSLFHDVKIGNFCTLSPYSSCLGASELSDNILLGSHSSLNPKIKISKSIYLGSHANATKDLKISGVYVGSPARKLKKLF